MIDPNLASYATVRQLEYLEAIDKCGSTREAAIALKINRRTLQRSMEMLRIKAARSGYAPEYNMTHMTAPGFRVKGTSTYYDESGTPKGQWVKTTEDAAQRDQAIRDAFAAMADDLPRLDPTPSPTVLNTQLATLYTLTDCHVGMLSWGRETGADWDLDIAEATLVGCFEQMIHAAPPATTGVVAQLGDFLHQDSIEAVTPTNRHLLDADGRFSKVVTVAVRVLRRIISMALTKHDKVIVIMAEGNHDITSSIWLRVMFRTLFENEPRVEVIDSELPYYVYQHGQTMLAFHHGHLKKNSDLPLLFAAQFPQVWGSTVKRYVHTGHRHHIEEKEHSGMLVVQHATLAARDAYAARGGWIAERQVKAITYHAQHGEVARNTIVPEMLT